MGVCWKYDYRRTVGLENLGSKFLELKPIFLINYPSDVKENVGLSEH